MCAIIGLAVKDAVDKKTILSLLTHLFLESKIRGLHATGISWTTKTNIQTVKEPVPADEFVKLLPNLGLEGHLFIGHCRYSTSDLEFNQPIADEHLSMVHNGVVTQENPEKWSFEFGGDFLTKNDSEIIFNCLKQDKNPMVALNRASMTVLSLQPKKLSAFRNGKRPMWFGILGDVGTIVTSTKDILLRAGIGNVHPSQAGRMYEILPDGPVALSQTLVEDWQ